MDIRVMDRDDAIAVLRVERGEIRSDAYARLRELCARAASSGHPAALIDLSQIKKISFAGLAALVELAATVDDLRLGFCGMPEKAKKRLSNAGLDRALPLFDDIDAALTSDGFRRCRLQGARAVILCADSSPKLAPLTDETSAGMLDLLGKPVLERVLEQMQSFGLRDFMLNPGEDGAQIPAHFRANRRRDRSIFFLNDRPRDSDGEATAPHGPLGALRRLHIDHHAFDDDIIVGRGDTLAAVDIAEMMDLHRSSGAEITIAATPTSVDRIGPFGVVTADTLGRVTSIAPGAEASAGAALAIVGVFAISPKALSRVTNAGEGSLARGLIAAVLAADANVQVHVSDAEMSHIGTARDYYQTIKRALAGDLHGLRPDATQQRPGLWVAPGAQVSPRARIDGLCYIAPDAVVSADAWIVGPTVIGAGAVIDAGAVVRSSIVQPDTWVGRNTLLDAQIAAPNWGLSHRFADGSPQFTGPLENVGAANVGDRAAQTG